MHIVRDPASLALVVHPAIRALIALRLDELSDGGAYNADELGDFIVVQPGDTTEHLDQHIGRRLFLMHATDMASHSPFELVERHGDFYECVLILSDDGYGLHLLVPQEPSIDQSLLAMCERYVTGTAPVTTCP